MSTHTRDDRTSAPSYPDATPAGDHLVVDRTEWVPGAHPDPHLRDPARAAYPETYLRCLRCGAEALHADDLPENCEPTEVDG